MGRSDKGIKKNKVIKILILLVVLVSAAVIISKVLNKSKTVSNNAAAYKTTTVERGNISSELSSSGTISPKDTYSITSLISGEVIAADFEEGDQVEAGQVLYVIDASSLESELRSAENSLERAQNSYQVAVSDYNDAANDYSGNTYKSSENGYIKTLYVKEGDRVSSNTKLADIYSDKVMKIRVPFLSVEAAQIGVGNQGTVTLSDSGEQLLGTVLSVSNIEETLNGGRLVRYVMLQVDNPGGLMTTHTATVQIGEWVCSEEGVFEPSIDTVMSANISGTVEIESMLVQEGDYVSKGSAVFKMTSKTAESLLRTYKDTMDKAQESIESAQNKVDSTQDSFENYTITAPISGTVITKTTKTGDKITSGGSNTVTMAVIYDMSQVKFEMLVDELDVQDIKVGQKVEISADAFEGKQFTGEVINISLQSATSNGVTNYPVTVMLDEVGDLLPGMNVDGRIILKESQDTLTIPVDSLMRGNRVYIKDETVTESNGAIPVGFRAVEVETGVINDSYIEILSGLSEGDEIYIAESSKSSGSEIVIPGGMQGGSGMPGGGMQGGGERPGGGSQGGRSGQ